MMQVAAKFILTALIVLASPILTKGQNCDCDACTQEILDRYSGFEPNRYKCGARIDYLQNTNGFTEREACIRVAGEEFPDVCGPECDPNRCNATPSPAGITPYPTFNPDPFNPNLYCFPEEPNRVTYENVWDDYKVQVKEGFCGPGNNHFSTETVSRSGNDITLEFKNTSGAWKGGEVRVVRTDTTPFSYGNYSFHVKSVQVLDGSNNIVSDVLPKDLVIGLFTWDPQDRYAGENSENQMHEVDVEISRWGQSSNPDAQFLMQPPGSPQMYRFFTGSQGTTYDQQDHWYSFDWLPTSVYWTTSAGGGDQTHLYTTEDAVKNGRRDLVQCLPAYVEVRLNLWNMFGNQIPDGLTDNNQFVRVVISDFTYEESDVTHANPGDYCSKHCQCQGDCINTRCEEISTDFPSPTPSMKPTSSPSSASCEEESTDRFFYKKNKKETKPIKKNCDWLRNKARFNLKKKLCEKETGFKDAPPAKDVCSITCGICGSCEDDDDTEFSVNKKQLVKEKCPWLRDQSDKKIGRICRRYAGDICLATCKKCVVDEQTL